MKKTIIMPYVMQLSKRLKFRTKAFLAWMFGSTNNCEKNTKKSCGALPVGNFSWGNVKVENFNSYLNFNDTDKEINIQPIYNKSNVLIHQILNSLINP